MMALQHPEPCAVPPIHSAPCSWSTPGARPHPRPSLFSSGLLLPVRCNPVRLSVHRLCAQLTSLACPLACFLRMSNQGCVLCITTLIQKDTLSQCTIDKHILSNLAIY